MGSLKMTAIATVAVLMGAPSVLQAADAPTPYYPPATPIEIGSNWYLRGDIGYKMYLTPNAHFDEPGYGAMINEDITNTGVIGIGMGFEFNDSFRMDLTLDYEWPGEFEGQLICPAPCASGVDPDYSIETADITAWTALINAYMDFGSWGSLTPYLGAGVGVSYLTTSNVAFVNPDGSTGTWGGDSTWNFAWALMAGVTYDLTYNLALDMNYRYVHLGDAQSAVIPILSGTQRIHYDDISAHEIRVGLRYMIY
ncbi:MAG: porin family protein [Bauldia sp.]|nr:porin family protein [Bauldia sp.]